LLHFTVLLKFRSGIDTMGTIYPNTQSKLLAVVVGNIVFFPST